MSTSLSPTKAPHLCLSRSLSPDACWHFGSSAPPIPVPPTPHPPLPPPPPLDASRRPSQCGTPSAAARPSNPSTPPLPANSTPPPHPCRQQLPTIPLCLSRAAHRTGGFRTDHFTPRCPRQKKKKGCWGKCVFVCVCGGGDRGLKDKVVKLLLPWVNKSNTHSVLL